MKMYGVLGFEREEPNYEYFELEIEFRYDYRPARMYMSNGDPGYPEETTADIWQIFNEDKIPSWITDDMPFAGIGIKSFSPKILATLVVGLAP